VCKHGGARAAPVRHPPERRLRRTGRAFSLALTLIVTHPARAEEPQRPLDLAMALTLARRSSPALDAARRRIDEARGELAFASAIVPENPELVVGAGPRFLDPGVSGDRLGLEAGLSQRLEVAGQRGHRMGRGRAQVAAAEAELKVTARALDLAVAIGFWQALAAGERARIAREHEGLARELLEIATARFERGAASPVEANGARIRLAEASRRSARSEAEARAAAVRLAPLCGLDPARPPALGGSLPSPSPSLPTLGAEALAYRPEVASAAARTRGANAASDLADASAWPDVRLGVRYATEEGSRALLGQLSVGLPLFQRNQGERERARAAAARAEAEERGVRAQVAADAEEARLEAARARDALALYDAEVLGSMEENLSLLRRMLEAGKISASEVIVLQRELLEGRLGYLDARLEVALADARVRSAAGLPIAEDSIGGAR
jgi:cobalt-zinc-cadmium efflux system outer membrane protein